MGTTKKDPAQPDVITELERSFRVACKRLQRLEKLSETAKWRGADDRSLRNVVSLLTSLRQQEIGLGRGALANMTDLQLSQLKEDINKEQRARRPKRTQIPSEHQKAVGTRNFHRGQDKLVDNLLARRGLPSLKALGYDPDAATILTGSSLSSTGSLGPAQDNPSLPPNGENQ